MLAKKQPEPTLSQRFLAAKAEAQRLGEELIQRHVDYLKECHKDLPRQSPEMDVRNRGRCSCVVAELIAKMES